MNSLFKNWGKHYYTEPLLLVVLFVTLAITLLHRQKYAILRYIPLYVASFIVACISNIASYFTNAQSYKQLLWGIGDYIDYFFTLIEMLVFSNFYYYVFDGNKLRKFIAVLTICFVLFFIVMLLTDTYSSFGVSEITQAKVYTVEGLTLLIACVLYFINLFNKVPVRKLKNEPTFWVSAGLLFFLTCTLPYSMLESFLRNQIFDLTYPLYALFYIFYIFLFLLIIRAFLCNPEKHTNAYLWKSEKSLLGLKTGRRPLGALG